MKNKFNITPLAALIALSLLFMGVGCEKQNIESDLKNDLLTGKVIGFENCTESYVGCLIDVFSPNGLGETVYYDGEIYENVVKTYSITATSIQLGQIVTGEYQILPDSLTKVCPDLYENFPVVEISLTF